MHSKSLLFGLFALGISTPLWAQEAGIRQILSQLGNRCNQNAGISYRSVTLADPQKQRQVFVSGSLLRHPYHGSQATDAGCFPSKATTQQITLHIVSPQGYERVIPLYRHRSTLVFNYVQPVSFSPDGRYLLLQVQSSNGIDLVSEIEVLDTYRAWLPLHIDFCKSAPFGEVFDGFMSRNRIFLRCLSGMENDRELWYLRWQVGEKTTALPLAMSQYGAIVQPLQVFP